MEKRITFRTPKGKFLQVECYDSLPSTLELARQYAKLGYADGYVVFSEKQTKFDSLARPITDSDGEPGVFISCILRPSMFASQAGFIGVTSAVALQSALEEQTEKRIGIGWLSDIFCDGRKIGHSAIEGKLDEFSAYEYIIVSFYTTLSHSDFPPRLSDLVKKVFESESASIPLIVAKKILTKFFDLYPEKMKTPEKIMEVYNRKFILGGVKAKYLDQTKRKSCKILGVDTLDGRLIIETSSGDIKRISGIKNIIIPDKIRIKSK